MIHVKFGYDDIQEFSMMLKNVTADPTKTEVLINSITKFIRYNQLDGVDIQDEWPKTPEGRANFLLFCKALEEKLTKLSKEEPYIISLVTGTKNDGTDYNDLLKYVDFLNVESHKYYGASLDEHPELMGPPSPLYSGHGKVPYENVNSTFNFYSCLTKLPKRLNLGVTFSGTYWEHVIKPDDSSDTLWMKAKPYDGHHVIGGTYPWRAMKGSWNMSEALWNDESKNYYFYQPEQTYYVAFEEERSLREKKQYAYDKNIGGIAIWYLDYDDDESSLLRVLATMRECFEEDDTVNKFICD